MSTADILFGVLFSLMALAIFFVIRLEVRLGKLFKGSKAADLEDLMGQIVDHVNALTHEAKDQASRLDALEARLKARGRGVRLVRFNPFSDVGSSQSFAVAIVNEEGDGVVFSSLYSRERMSVFAKPVTAGKSDIELTPEEQSVVADALEDASK